MPSPSLPTPSKKRKSEHFGAKSKTKYSEYADAREKDRRWQNVGKETVQWGIPRVVLQNDTTMKPKIRWAEHAGRTDYKHTLAGKTEVICENPDERGKIILKWTLWKWSGFISLATGHCADSYQHGISISSSMRGGKHSEMLTLPASSEWVRALERWFVRHVTPPDKLKVNWCFIEHYVTKMYGAVAVSIQSFLSLRNFMFSHRCFSGLSCGMWRSRVIRNVGPGKFFCDPLTPEDEGNTTTRNVRNHSPEEKSVTSQKTWIFTL